MKSKKFIIIPVIFIILLFSSGFLLCFYFWGKYDLQFFKMKRELRQCQFIEKVLRMSDQKDFEVCYDVYLKLKNKEDVLFTRVHFENEQLIYYKAFLEDENQNRQSEIILKTDNVFEAIEQIIQDKEEM